MSGMSVKTGRLHENTKKRGTNFKNKLVPPELITLKKPYYYNYFIIVDDVEAVVLKLSGCCLLPLPSLVSATSHHSLVP